MVSVQILRFISFSGAFIIGVWLPLELCGYLLAPKLTTALDIAVSFVSIVHIYAFCKDNDIKLSKINPFESPILLVDLFCMIPFSILLSSHQNWLVLLNLPCVIHVRYVRDFLNEFGSLKPMTYRLIPIFLMLPVLVHTIACAWIFMGAGNTVGGDDPVSFYVKALYWTITTLTTVGYGDITPVTNAQMLFANGVQIVGVGVFGFVLSNVASLLSRADAAREHHMDNIDRIDTFMRIHKIPHSLRSKTRAYYHYLWQHKKGYLDASLVEGLPAKLQSELFFQINKSIIDKVSFLKDADPNLIEELMDGLEPHIFVPGEKIFKAGEDADALYFIHAGQVDIFDRSGKQLASLREGDFFGEMSLLNDKPRSATAVAKSFCDVYLLHKKTFAEVIEHHPNFKKHLESVVASRMSHRP